MKHLNVNKYVSFSLKTDVSKKGKDYCALYVTINKHDYFITFIRMSDFETLSTIDKIEN